MPATQAFLGLAASLVMVLSDTPPATMSFAGTSGDLVIESANIVLSDAAPTAVTLGGASGDGVVMALSDAAPSTLALVGLDSDGIRLALSDTILSTQTYAGLGLDAVAATKTLSDTILSTQAYTGLTGSLVQAQVVLDAEPGSLAYASFQDEISLTRTLLDTASASILSVGLHGTLAALLPDAAPTTLWYASLSSDELLVLRDDRAEVLHGSLTLTAEGDPYHAGTAVVRWNPDALPEEGASFQFFMGPDDCGLPERIKFFRAVDFVAAGSGDYMILVDGELKASGSYEGLFDARRAFRVSLPRGTAGLLVQVIGSCTGELDEVTVLYDPAGVLEE